MASIGPMFFNDLLRDQVSAVNEDGKAEKMAVHAFVCRGDKIAANLENRVVTFIANCDNNKGFLIQNRDNANALIAQYSDFAGLIDKVKFVAKDFELSLPNYSLDLEIKMVESCAIMNLADAQKISKILDDFISRITNRYFSNGIIRSYLPDQINKLLKLLT